MKWKLLPSHRLYMEIIVGNREYILGDTIPCRHLVIAMLSLPSWSERERFSSSIYIHIYLVRSLI